MHEWPLNPHPSPCTCAHVDTLSPPALYVPTRGTPYPPCSRVFIEQTLNTPDPPPLFMYMKQGGGEGGSVFHHRDQACPHSSSVSSKPTPRRRMAGRLRASRSPQNRCPAFRTRRLSTSFSSFCSSLSGTDAPKNNSSGKKGEKKNPPPAAVRGCVPHAFICDVFDVRSTEVTRGGGSSAGLK